MSIVRTLLVALAITWMPATVRRADASCSRAAEEGRWKNDDARTNTVGFIDVRFVCQEQTLNGEPYPPGATWHVRVLGRCLPGDCDWSEVGAERLEAGFVYGVYEQGFARRFIWARMSQLRPGHLWVYMWTDFADDNRPDYVVQAWFHRE